MNSRISFFISNILGGIVCVTVVGGILALASESDASTIAGYVQVSPNDCQVEYLSEDNQIYTFLEDCSE